jgi:hypothetical protein
MRKSVRRFDGKPFLLLGGFQSKNNVRNVNAARAYARIARAKGLNARVVQWKDASGVYVNRRFNRVQPRKSLAESRRLWRSELSDVEDEINMFGGVDGIRFFGSEFMKSTMDTQAGAYTEKGLDAFKRKIAPREFSPELELDFTWVGIDPGSNDVLAAWNKMILADFVQNEEAYRQSSIGKAEQYPEDSVPPDELDMIREANIINVEQWIDAMAQDNVRPVWINNIGSRSNMAVQRYESPNFNVGAPSYRYYGIERTGDSIFDFEMQPRRYQVAMSWTDEEGYVSEIPLMAFGSKDKAQEYLNNLIEIGNENGGEISIATDFSLNRQTGEVDEDEAWVFPLDLVEFDIIREDRNSIHGEVNTIQNVARGMNVDEKSDLPGAFTGSQVNAIWKDMIIDEQPERLQDEPRLTNERLDEILAEEADMVYEATQEYGAPDNPGVLNPTLNEQVREQQRRFQVMMDVYLNLLQTLENAEDATPEMREAFIQGFEIQLENELGWTVDQFEYVINRQMQENMRSQMSPEDQMRQRLINDMFNQVKVFGEDSEVG